MTVLFVTRKWPPAIGGMETYSVEISNSLRSLCNLKTLYLSGKFESTFLKIISLFYFFPSIFLKLLSLKRYDVIHIGDLVLWPILFFAKLLGLSKVFVVSVHGLDMLYAKRNGFLPKIYSAYLKLCIYFLSNHLKIISNSNATKKLAIELGFKQIKVVTSGVVSSGAPQKFSSPKNYVLFVGRLIKRKGAGWFAKEVLPLLPKNFKMVVVGKAVDSSELKIIKENPRVDYKGVVSNNDLELLRRSALVVLMPNIPLKSFDIEGFGLTAIEAAAQGSIMLASNIEGIRDAVFDNQTGFLLPPRKPKIWAKKIMEIHSWHIGRREQFIKKSQEIVRKEFSWEKVAKNTLNAYEINIKE